MNNFIRNTSKYLQFFDEKDLIFNAFCRRIEYPVLYGGPRRSVALHHPHQEIEPTRRSPGPRPSHRR